MTATPPSPPAARRLLSAALTATSRGLTQVRHTAEAAQLVTRYLRGRLEFQPRADDIWVVTYPRSGTTWVQFLLYQLTTDGAMGFHHLTEVSPWFERSLAIGTHRARDFEAVGSPRIFKSHLTPGWLPSQGRVVYVRRAPEDVALSYYHFYCSHLGYGEPFDAFFQRFLSGRLQYGAWADHVADWERASRHRHVIALTYEELRRDPEVTVQRLCTALGLHPTAEARSRALARSRFDFMKEHEAQFDHVTAVLQERGLRPHAFLRRGQTGEGATQLTEEQRASLRAARLRAPTRQGRRLDLAAFLH